MIFILTELGLIHIFRTFNPFDNHIRRHFAIHFLFYGFWDHLSRDLNFRGSSLKTLQTVCLNSLWARFKFDFVQYE